MSQVAEIVLKRLVDQYGRRLISDPRRLESFLKDFMPNAANSERLGLIAVVKANLVDAMLASPDQAITALQIEKWVDQLYEETGLDTNLMRRSLRIWAAALGRSVEDNGSTIKAPSGSQYKGQFTEEFSSNDAKSTPGEKLVAENWLPWAGVGVTLAFLSVLMSSDVGSLGSAIGFIGFIFGIHLLRKFDAP